MFPHTRSYFAARSALAAGALACALAAGCDARPQPPVAVGTAGISPAADYRPLAEVLLAAVSPDGLLHRQALKDAEPALDRQLKLLAVTGPESTPLLLQSEDEVLAYWYNARLAWAMKLLLLAGLPQKLSDETALLDRPFTLDGGTMTLREIDRILADDGDWRTLAAAPGVLLNRASPPTRPFAPADIRQQIERRLRTLVDDEKRFVIDIERRTLRLPPALWQLRGRIIEDYQNVYGAVGADLATAMLASLEGSSARRVREAQGYRLAQQQPPWKTALAKW